MKGRNKKNASLRSSVGPNKKMYDMPLSRDFRQAGRTKPEQEKAKKGVEAGYDSALFRLHILGMNSRPPVLQERDASINMTLKKREQTAVICILCAYGLLVLLRQRWHTLSMC